MLMLRATAGVNFTQHAELLPVTQTYSADVNVHQGAMMFDSASARVPCPE
jgi:hypothetical protein